MGGIIQVGSWNSSVERKSESRYIDASMPLEYGMKDQFAAGYRNDIVRKNSHATGKKDET